MKKHLIVLLLIHFLSSPLFAERIYHTDFSDGTFDGWSVGSGVTVAADPADSSKYAIRVENHYAGDKVFRNFGSLLNRNELFFRWKWYTQSWDSGEGVKFSRWRGTTELDNPYAEFFVAEGSSPSYYYGGVFRDTNNAVSSIGYLGGAWTNMGMGEGWTTILQRLKYNDSGQTNGIVQCWFNNVLRYSITNKSYRPAGNTDYIDWWCITGNPGTGADMGNSIHFVKKPEIFTHYPREFSAYPIVPNPSASGSTNIHYSRGNRRIVRIGDTVIMLVAEAISSENTYRSTDGGLSWSLIDSDIAQSGALITGPDGYVYHFFRSGTTIRMVRFLYNASTIPAPVTIYSDAEIANNNVGVYRSTGATVDSTGRLFVAESWVNSSTGRQTIYVLSSSNNGATWSYKNQVSNGSTYNWLYPDMDCMTDDTLVVSYGMWDDGTHQFQNWVALSSDGAQTWTRRQVSTTSWVYNPCLLTVGDDTLYVFAQSGNAAPLKGLVFSKSVDKGQTWTAWTLIDATCEYADPSAALGEDGSIIVGYRTNNFTGAPTEGSCGDRTRFALRQSTNGGSSWSLVDNYFEGDRVGTKVQVRYQTHFNYGGQLDWAWMQYINNEANLPTFYDNSDAVYIAEDGGQSTSPTPTPSPTGTPPPDPTPTPTPVPTATPTPEPTPVSFFTIFKGSEMRTILE